MKKPKKDVHRVIVSGYRVYDSLEGESYHAKAECDCGRYYDEDEIARILNAYEREKSRRKK